MRLFFSLVFALTAVAELPRESGYRGIWYMNEPTGDEYGYKYSGGFATYPQQHVPIAIYSREVNKTFFVYGGTVEGKQELLHMVSYFDHRTGTVPRPVILLNKKTDDAHDNPVLSIDAKGHLWVFSNAHGTQRPAWIHRSRKPYNIDDFEQVYEGNYSYGNPWYLNGDGFLFLHTRYESGRRGIWATRSSDGLQWSPPRQLAFIEGGNYLLSHKQGSRVGAVLDMHPRQGGVNSRTNLYYMETRDGGSTWTNAAGKEVALPLKAVANEALIHDFQSQGLLVYKKDLQFDRDGRPVVLYLTSKSWRPGSAGGPHRWYTARWTGAEWQHLPFTTSDHNYDFGSLYIESSGLWRIIAPTDPGPEAFGTGGSVVMWTSTDQGHTWKRIRDLTPNAVRMHTYVRRPLNAHPDFYAFWADGLTRKPSDSDLYFSNQNGSAVWRLPRRMTADHVKPERVR